MLYLDHNATTPLLPEVAEAMLQVAKVALGNPGSRHAAGRRSRQILEDAREQVAEVLGALPTEVIFTSGGTEATNMALVGFARGRQGVVLLPPGEHPATVETVEHLAGVEVVPLPIDDQGQLRTDCLSELPWDRVVCATLLLAHNETGAIQDVALIREHCAAGNVPWHLDAVQAVGKIPVSFRELGCTTMAVGAHKFCGPRGIGALLVKQGVRLPPLLYGGHQERGLRPGTEPVMLAVGMARALLLWQAHQHERLATLTALRDRLQLGLVASIPDVFVHSAKGRRLPNTLSIAFPGCSADALLVALDLAGMCCSIGSACASGSTRPSPILIAMNCPDDIARSTLRLSVGIQNTIAEIDTAIELITRVVSRLRQEHETASGNRP